MMALYLKLHVMRSTIYVESFMVLRKVHNIANFGGYAVILIVRFSNHIYLFSYPLPQQPLVNSPISATPYYHVRIFFVDMSNYSSVLFILHVRFCIVIIIIIIPLCRLLSTPTLHVYIYILIVMFN